MACSNFNKFGILFYFQELSVSEREAYQHHLENCSECYKQLEKLKWLQEFFQSKKIFQPQIEVVEKVLEQANDIAKNKIKKRTVYFRLPSTAIRPVAIVSLALLLIIISTFIRYRKEPSNLSTSKEEFTWQYSLDDSFNTIQVSIDQIKNYHENTFLFSEFEYFTFDNRFSDIKLGIESLNNDIKKNSF